MSKVKAPGMRAAQKFDASRNFTGYSDKLVRDPFVNSKLTENLAGNVDLNALKLGENVKVAPVLSYTARAFRAPIDCPYEFRNPRKFWQPQTLGVIASARLTAKRFYFDADASFRIGDMMQHNMPFVIDNMAGVHFPYDPLYLVMDAQKSFLGRGGIRTPDADGDNVLSFLISNGIVYSVIGDSKTSVVGILQFAFNAEQQPIADIDAEDLNTLRMAYIYGGQRKDWQIAVPHIADKKIKINIALNSLPMHGGAMFDRQAANELISVGVAGGGDPLLCLAALMMLNSQHEVVVRDHVPAKRAMVKGGKSVALPEYHAVHIVQGKRTVTTKTIMATVDRRPAREHDVRGHFVHYGNDGSNCDHVWEPMDVFQKRYRCRTCGMRRTWKQDFKRGDASIGKIEKHYEIHT